MTLAGKSLGDFLDVLGSDAPTPGGGGAAALSGALAAGLVTMVARLTAGREAYAAHEERVQEIIRVGDHSRTSLLAAIDGDAAAFNALMATYKLPKNTPEEKEQRTASIQTGLVGATESPLGIARQCALLAEMAAELAEFGNPHAISDAATAAILAEAALQGALMQARINLRTIKDGNYVGKIRAEIEELEKRSRIARDRASAVTITKLG